MVTMNAMVTKGKNFPFFFTMLYIAVPNVDKNNTQNQFGKVSQYINTLSLMFKNSIFIFYKLTCKPEIKK